MSLINDALKRAKHAQAQTPPAAGGPELKPAEAAPVAAAPGASKTFYYVMVACVVAGNLFLFLYLANQKQSAPQAAPATGAPPVVTAPVVQSKPAAPPTVVASVPVSAPAAAPAEVTNAPAVETVSVVAAVPEPPKPAPLRLQSVVLNGARSSAMISGKFLFVGDRIQGWRVAAIDQESVTLVGNGQTNVLALP